eukprot:PhM_4_TR13334/c1_g3_i1/m.17470
MRTSPEQACLAYWGSGSSTSRTLPRRPQNGSRGRSADCGKAQPEKGTSTFGFLSLHFGTLLAGSNVRYIVYAIYSICYNFPLNGCQPSVLEELPHARARLMIHTETLCHEVTTFTRNVCREVRGGTVGLTDAHNRAPHVRASWPRRHAAVQQLGNGATHRPNVPTRSVQNFRHDFWREPMGGSDERGLRARALGRGAWARATWEQNGREVAQLRRALTREHDIIALDVAVHNVDAVKVQEGIEHVADTRSDKILRQLCCACSRHRPDGPARCRVREHVERCVAHVHADLAVGHDARVRQMREELDNGRQLVGARHSQKVQALDDRNLRTESAPARCGVQLGGRRPAENGADDPRRGVKHRSLAQCLEDRPALVGPVHRGRQRQRGIAALGAADRSADGELL